MAEAGRPDPEVWYVAYGSNTSTERLACYLRGGRPLGASRTYPGARDPRPPRRSVAMWLSGTVRFAGESSVWGGGMAFYLPGPRGRVAAVGHLLRLGQVMDVLVQEMHRDPAALDLQIDLADLAVNTTVALGAGRYETVVRLPDVDGVPALTLTAPHGAPDLPDTPPSSAYLSTIEAGLAEHHR